MRNLVFVIILFAFAANVAAQERTLLNDDSEKGGFGGPVVKLTSIRDQSAVMVGGRGGWIIGHSLLLGGGGYAVASEVDAPERALSFFEGPLDIEFGYFGFELEYVVHPKSLGHFSFYTLIGGGAINYVKDVGPVTRSNEQAGETNFVFVLEPALNTELNVTTWFHLSAGVSYRLVTGVNQERLKNQDFSGLTATLTFKFGNF